MPDIPQVSGEPCRSSNGGYPIAAVKGGMAWKGTTKEPWCRFRFSPNKGVFRGFRSSRGRPIPGGLGVNRRSRPSNRPDEAPVLGRGVAPPVPTLAGAPPPRMPMSWREVVGAVDDTITEADTSAGTEDSFDFLGEGIVLPLGNSRARP